VNAHRALNRLTRLLSFARYAAKIHIKKNSFQSLRRRHLRFLHHRHSHHFRLQCATLEESPRPTLTEL
jgi:hypothetical protein